jgi:hypothetical protein
MTDLETIATLKAEVERQEVELDELRKGYIVLHNELNHSKRKPEAQLMDYPTAWKITRASKDEDHDPKCSWILARMLCDCHVVYGKNVKCGCCNGTGSIKDTAFIDGDESACMTCNGTGKG